MSTDIVIRTGFVRLRYAVLFEGPLVALFSVAMFVVFERIAHAVVVHTYYFTLAYDRVFPVEQSHSRSGVQM